jgi:hypothetical protein
VPDQEIFIYFAIDNSDYSISASDELPKNFISQITFKGGKGKPGQPMFLFVTLISLLIALTIADIVLIGKVIFQKGKIAAIIELSEKFKQREEIIISKVSEGVREAAEFVESKITEIVESSRKQMDKISDEVGDFVTSQEYHDRINEINKIMDEGISKGEPRTIFEDSLRKYLGGVKYGGILLKEGLKIFDSKKAESEKSK